MIARYFNETVLYPSATASLKKADDAVRQQAETAIAEFGKLFDDYQFSRALEAAWSLVSSVNKYLVEQEPWSVADREGQENRSRLATILYTSAEALRIVTALVHPVLPESTAKIWQQLGPSDLSNFDLATLKGGQLPRGGNPGQIIPPFPRADKSAIERMTQLEQERNSA